MWFKVTEKRAKERFLNFRTKVCRSKQRRQMWNVRGMWFSGEMVLWSLLDLCFPADYGHDPPRPSTSVVFTYYCPSLPAVWGKVLFNVQYQTEWVTSLLRATVPPAVHSCALCNHDRLLAALPEISAHKRAVFKTSGKECLAVCREGQTPNSAMTAQVALQLNVSLL